MGNNVVIEQAIVKQAKAKIVLLAFWAFSTAIITLHPNTFTAS